MAKPAQPLNDDILVASVAEKKSRKLFDGGGLYLEITPAGSKIWRMKFRGLNGKENRMTFGRYPEVSIERARGYREETRHLLREGIDPRRDYSAKQIQLTGRVCDGRPLPEDFARERVRLKTSQVAKAASAEIVKLAFPALFRTDAAEYSIDNLAQMVDMAQRASAQELTDALYEICVAIAWDLLDAGMPEVALRDAMMDARREERRRLTRTHFR